jgi:rhamnogalacturonyl hydrolase YesR
MKARHYWPIICLGLLSARAMALTEFDADSIVSLMQRVAHYRMTYCTDIKSLFNHANTATHHHPIDHGDQINPWETLGQGNSWDAASFMTGLMALYRTSSDTTYLNFARRWSEAFNWQPRDIANGGEIDDNYGAHADHECAIQTYAEIFMLDPVESNRYMISPAREDFSRVFDQIKPVPTKWWWWCDAIYMAPPAIVRFCKASDQPLDQRFLDSMDVYYWKASGFLYDNQHKFWFRDKSFFYPGRTCINGQPMFWSCGEAWVLGGLARILEYLPQDYPHRPAYETQFREMCAAVKAQQGFNDLYPGLWTTSMLDHDNYPDPETSGSAFFCFAFAWGVRNGLLDSAEYAPAINAAWRDLVKNIGDDGRLRRCQHVDLMPQTDLSNDINNSSPEGEGAFLQAAAEMVLRDRAETRAIAPAAMPSVKLSAIVLTARGITVTRGMRPGSRLAVYSPDGRLVRDLTVHLSEKAGSPVTMSWRTCGLRPGVYTIVLNEGGKRTARAFATVN